MKKENNQNCWFLLGPTGIGKSFVSLYLGQLYKNVIINTDAFSLYKEASIMTAKVSKEDQNKVQHKMIDILDLFNINYNQYLFKKDALTEINLIFKNNQIPLIVGGTNYFIECLLFNYNNISDNNNNINNNEEKYNPIEIMINDEKIKNMKLNDNTNSIYLLDEIKKIQNEVNINNNNKDECYIKLNEYLNNKINKGEINKSDILYILSVLDEKYSLFYNENDIRRIINVIAHNIIYSQKKSDIIKNQKINLNFDKTKIIILFPKDLNELLKQITSRIDTMIENGLSEIIYIFHKFIINNKKINFEVGVLQSIGYKEFYDLYKNLDINIINNIYSFHIKKTKEDNENNMNNIKIFNKNIIENVINKDEKIKKLFNDCREKLINNTLNYAKYQIKFIKKRILPFIKGYHIQEINFYSKEKYNEEYIPQMIKYLNNDEYIQILEDKNKSKIEEWKKYFCEICQCELNGDNEYNNHMKSNKHKKKKENLRKKEKYNKFKNEIDININNKFDNININVE